MDNALSTSNTVIVYKLSFYQNIFHLDPRSDLHLDTAWLSVNTLDLASLGIIGNLITLSNVRAGQSALDTFDQEKIDTMIVYLSTD